MKILKVKTFLIRKLSKIQKLITFALLYSLVANIYAQNDKSLRVFNNGFNKKYSITVDKENVLKGYEHEQMVLDALETELAMNGLNVISQAKLNNSLRIKNDVNTELKLDVKAYYDEAVESAYLITTVRFNEPIPISGNKLKKFSAKIVDVKNNNEIIAVINYDGKGKKYTEFLRNLVPMILERLE